MGVQVKVCVDSGVRAEDGFGFLGLGVVGIRVYVNFWVEGLNGLGFRV